MHARYQPSAQLHVTNSTAILNSALRVDSQPLVLCLCCGMLILASLGSRGRAPLTGPQRYSTLVGCWLPKVPGAQYSTLYYQRTPIPHTYIQSRYELWELFTGATVFFKPVLNMSCLCKHIGAKNVDSIILIARVLNAVEIIFYIIITFEYYVFAALLHKLNLFLNLEYTVRIT